MALPLAEPLVTDRSAWLADLPPGSRAVVQHVDDSCPVGRRLLDLGFVPGTPVRVSRRAPLGDPIVFEIRGSRLCLRRTEANRVRVRVE
jgi:ferrous iron transport protein A